MPSRSVRATPASRQLRTSLNGSLVVTDEHGGPLVRSNRVTYLDADYLVSLRHDGATVSTTVDSKPTAKTGEFGTWTRGRVFLHACGTEASRFSQFTIEGTLDAEGLAAMREQFGERRLRAIFGGK